MARKATGGKPGRPFHPELLTPAEQRVLEGVRDGLHNAEIGVRLGISPDGVKFHVSNMLTKLNLSSREELARWNAPRESALRRLWLAIPATVKWTVGGVTAVAVVGGVAAVFLLGGSSGSAPAYPDGLVSVSSSGEPGNGNSAAFSVSGDGRYVAFQSSATNLVPGDTNGVDDIFVRDRLDGTTTRISIGLNHQEANGASREPVISRDGRHVAFTSVATNLVDTPPVTDDAALAVLPDQARTFYSTPGRPPNALDPVARSNVYEYDADRRTTSLVSQAPGGGVGNLGSAAPSISADGRYVAFGSLATNLVPGDTNATLGGSPVGDFSFEGVGDGEDIFVRDTVAGTTIRASVASDGSQADHPSASPAISADGKTVAFLSSAGNLSPSGNGEFRLFVHSIASGKTFEPLPFPGAQVLRAGRPSVSDDGSVVAIIALASTFPPGTPSSSRQPTTGATLSLVHPATGKVRAVAFEDLGNEAALTAALDGSGNVAVFSRKPDATSASAVISAIDASTSAETTIHPAALFGPNAVGFYPALSGDGHYVAFGIAVGGKSQIAIQRR